MTRIFVYGTLLRSEPNHGLLAGAFFIGRATTHAAYRLYDLGLWPALVEGGETAVLGECYAVDSALLSRLDAFEEVPHLYVRKRISLRNGPAAEAWFYRGKVSNAPLIDTGDWLGRSGRG